MILQEIKENAEKSAEAALVIALCIMVIIFSLLHIYKIKNHSSDTIELRSEVYEAKDIYESSAND